MVQMMNICMVKLIWSKEGEINSKRAWEEHHGLDMENMLGKTSTKSEIKNLELDKNKMERESYFTQLWAYTLQSR